MNTVLWYDSVNEKLNAKLSRSEPASDRLKRVVKCFFEVIMFEKFLNSRSKTGVPCVSGFFKSRKLCFNRAALRKYELDKYEFCNLYFDKENSLIGFEFIVEADPGAVKISKSKYGIGVSCGVFATQYKFSFDDVKKAPITSDGKMLIISI